MTTLDDELAPPPTLDTGWMAAAACNGLDTRWFFPERGEDVREARRICNGCPVRLQCLDYALELNIKHGIWGATSERKRRAMRRRKRGGQRKPAGSNCGTVAGYSAHRRRKEDACPACRAAHAARQLRWKAEQRAARLDGAA